MAFVEPGDAELVAPVLILDTGIKLALVAERFADVEAQLRLAQHLVRGSRAARADVVDEAGEFGVDAAQAEGNRPGWRDLITAAIAGTAAGVAAVIPETTPPAGRTLVRSTDLDTAMASYLLGSNPTFTDKGGGIYAYQHEQNVAQFRSNGGFEIGRASCRERV